MYFKGKNYWAVILGGSSGFGLATAQLLAQQGMNLCIVHRDRRQRLAEIEAQFEVLSSFGVEVVSFNQDALKEENRQSILENLRIKLDQKQGGVRLLLHAIAKGNLKRMVPESEGQEMLLRNQDFVLTIQAMALSLYDWTKGLWESNVFAEDARILGLTSAGNTKAWPYYAAVSAAKSTLEALVRSMALEFAPFGIRTNVIQAGITDTPSLRMIPGHEHLMEYAEKHNPFRRLTKPEDVAQVVYLLTRDEAAWINGALIPVDGGEKLV
ncbi:MAG: SDR family oxidoreductase [Saprospiraceae bacterium]|nr:SDR family oxidoreductase [Saprospiraceae bacterium]